MNKKNTLHKILTNSLDADTEQELFNSKQAEKTQLRIWELTSKDKTPSFNKVAVYAKIEQKLFTTNLKQSKPFKWIYLVASLVVGVVISNLFWGIKSSKSVPQQQMYVWSNGRQHIQSISLPDGTSVLLGPNSTLSYPKNFTEAQRRVELEGQGFFDVAKNEHQPFIVVTSEMEVMALGTAFEVFAFEGNRSAETTLLNGVIKVTLPLKEHHEAKEFILIPNHKLTLQNKTYKIEEIDADSYLTWRDKKTLTFVDQPLSVIIPRLENWYGKQILCEKSIADTYRFSFTIDTDSFRDIMKFIDRVSVLTAIEEGETYRILKK